MTKKLFTLIMALTLSVGSSSCGGSKGIVHDASNILSKIEASYRTTSDLTLKGTMKISVAPVTIWYEAAVKEHDSLKIVMNGPFGIAVGALAATPEHFTFLNFQDGIAYEGKPDRQTLERASTLKLNYQEIVSLMRCEVPHIPTKDEMEEGKMEVEQKDGRITYTIPQEGITESFTVDPDNLVILEYKQTRKVNGKEVTDLLVTYNKFFHKVGSRKFPEEAKMEVNGGEMKMTVTFEKVKGEIPADERLAINIPAGMDRESL
ncbi:MAG: DUF4292 domain-containing protein [Ignavibacteriae bacterium]|nr:DUF4292 domain-containing protein [Ignavibacteriota bacterium]MCB9215340.1 DUF4292 domain-containing protein [Ignavibacteria bacterium]